VNQLIGWNLNILQKSTLLDKDYLRATTIEAWEQYRYPKASSKTPTYFWITTVIRKRTIKAYDKAIRLDPNSAPLGPAVDGRKLNLRIAKPRD
jgi:hypothetical protein